MQSKDEQIG